MDQSARLVGRNPEPFIAQLPGSKSYTNRALVLAAQRVGATRIVNALHAEDTLLLAQCLDRFEGLTVERTDFGFRVVRTAERLGVPNESLFIGGAGTPARLLIAFATAVDGATVIAGNDRLCERPMNDLVDSLRDAGYRIEELGASGCLPLRVHGGPPTHREWKINGSVSSQFTTALLIHAAQVDGDPVDVHVHDHLVSKPYVRMTVRMMNDCGIRVESTDLSHLKVFPSRPTLDSITIEADASAMSYFLGAAALTQSTVVVPDINLGSEQGDVGFAQVLMNMGCTLSSPEDQISLTGAPLRGIDVNMGDMPDTVLTLAAVAPFAKGQSRITNIANLRVKECDRIHAAYDGLERLGVKSSEGPDCLIVDPSGPIKAARIRTFDDHRVAMAFALAGLMQDGIEIEEPACVGKSFPNFWNELSRFRDHHSVMELAI